MSKAATKAYDAIRARILSGELAPGSHLKEEELAEFCGVSRTPLRDALRSLAADFYVSTVPNHGTFVSDWSVADIDDIFTLRGMLEGYAAQRAASRVTREHYAAAVEDRRHDRRQPRTCLDAGTARGAVRQRDRRSDGSGRSHRSGCRARDAVGRRPGGGDPAFPARPGLNPEPRRLLPSAA